MAQANERLLVVDDEELNRDLMSRRLRRNGFSVEVAEDGPRALERLSADPPDLVLLDTMMPGMNGFEVLKRLRASYKPEALPVIMVTAVTESQRIAEALELGANDYITKPVDFTMALARIRSHLSRKSAENALRRSEERYARAVRGANDGLWDWTLANREIYLSERWKSMLGYQQGEIGRNPEEWFSRVHRDDLERLRDAINSVAAAAFDDARAAGETIAVLRAEPRVDTGCLLKNGRVMAFYYHCEVTLSVEQMPGTLPAIGFAGRCGIRESGSRPRTCVSCSSPSRRWIPRPRGNMAEPGWGCLSASASAR